ncbi:hypothetical protein ACYULU_01635 [Breznakiellaceae bacterium SP9]
MTDEDNAKEMYEMCKEFGYLGANPPPFDTLYALVQADKSSPDVAADRKLLGIIAGLSFNPRLLDELQYCNQLDEKTFKEDFDIQESLYGFFIRAVAAAADLAGCLLPKKKGGSVHGEPFTRIPQSQSQPRPPASPGGQKPSPSPAPKPLAISRQYLLLSVDPAKFNEKFPDAKGSLMLSAQNWEAFFYLLLSLSPSLERSDVQMVQSKITATATNDSGEKMILSIELSESDMAAFQKNAGYEAKRKGFENLVGKTISVLGTISLEQFGDLGLTFNTIV